MSVASSASYQGDGQLPEARKDTNALAIFGLDDEDDEEDLDTEQTSIVKGIFGTIYTVSRERTVSWQFVAIKLTLDAWQLLTLTINTQYGWTIKSDTVWWQVLSFIQLTSFMEARGEAFFLACLYAFAFLLLMTLVLCIWVAHAFKNKRFDHVWPITFLRFFGVTFFQLLDVASMSFFLMTMDCQYFDVDPELLYHHQEFPDQHCWSMPYLINIVLAAVSLLVFVLLSAVFQMGEIELDMATRNPLGMAHSRVEVQSFLLKFLMAAASTFLNNKKWLSTFYTTASLLLVYLSVAWLPYFHSWMNYLRTAVYMAVLYSAACMMLLVFKPGTDPTDGEAVSAWNSRMTLVMLVGLLPAGLFGALVAWLQTYYYGTYIVGKFKTAAPGRASTQIHRFKHPLEVAIAARVCRTWLPDNDEVLDQHAVHTAGVILKAGMEQLPGALMSILYSNYLFDIKGSYQSGLIDLKEAKKADPSFTDRFSIFSREQQHTQRASGAKGADLLSYVEQQRDLRAAIKVHKESLLATSAFWRCLVSPVVKLGTVSAAVAEFDRCVQQADKVYRSVISSNPDNWKLVRLYAKFVEYIKNDPWTAAKWNAEADRLFQAEDDEKYHIGVTEAPVLAADTTGASAFLQAAVEDDSLGIIMINAQCTITNVNIPTCDMLGYTRKQLLGKNVNIIIPPPFAHAHDSLVLNHIKTGKCAVSNKTSYLIALHREGHVVHIATYITRVSGEGMDSAFMAVIQQITPPADKARAWAMASGIIISVDAAFTDMFGYTAKDLPAGTNISSLCQEPEPMVAALKAAKAKQSLDKLAAEKLAARDSAHELGQPGLTLAGSPPKPAEDVVIQQVQLRHKYAGPVTCRAVVSNEGGGGLNHFLFLMFDRPAEHQSIIVSDARGKVHHVSQALAECLGYSVPLLLGEMAASAWDVLLPEPFCQLHRNFIRAELPETRPTYSCRSGVSVCLMAKTSEGPEPQPFTAKIKQRRMEDGQTFTIASLDKSTIDKALDERMLSIMVDEHGTILEVGNSPEALFGFPPRALLGRPISCVLDVFRREADPGEGIDVDEERHEYDVETAALLQETVVELAVRSLSAPGSSYRVGVSPPPEERHGSGQGEFGMLRSAITEYMLAEELTPAVMKVKLHTKASKPPPAPLAPRPSNVTSSAPRVIPRRQSELLVGSMLHQPPALPDAARISEGWIALQALGAGLNPRPSFQSSRASLDGPSRRSMQLAPPMAPLMEEVASSGSGHEHEHAQTQGQGQSPFLQCAGAGGGAGVEKVESELRLELQLWRVDLITGILHLDASGRIVGTSRTPLYEPGPLLGASSQSLLGAHIGDLLPPMHNRPVTDLLLPELGTVTVGARAKKGGLKHAKVHAVKDQKPGATSILSIRHRTDGLPLNLSIQAVHDWGPKKGFHVVLHVHNPSTGMRGFGAWMKKAKAAKEASPVKERRAAVGTWASLTRSRSPAEIQEQPAAPTPTPKPFLSPAALLRGGELGSSDCSGLEAILDSLDTARGQLTTGPELEVAGHRPKSNDASAAGSALVRRSLGFQDLEPSSPGKDAVWGAAAGAEPADQKGPEVQEVEASDHVLQWVRSGRSHTSRVDVDVHACIRKAVQPPGGEGREGSWVVGPGSVTHESVGEEHVEPGAVKALLPSPGEAWPAAAAAGGGEVHASDDGGAAAASAPQEEGEAGSYRRGQRFKRIARMLTGEAARRSLRRFKFLAWAAAGFVLVASLVGFVTMYVLLDRQRADVELLNVVGLTGVYTANLFMAVSNCDMVFTNHFVPGLRGLESVDDIQATCLDLTTTNAALMATSLTKSYYTIMRMGGPGAAAIQRIWNEPVNNYTHWTDTLEPGVMTNEVIPASLWDIGNKFCAAAANMAQNIRAKNASSPVRWRDWSVAQTVATNMDALSIGIADTMDGLVPIVIDNGLGVNKVHYQLMAVEGVVCSFIAVIFVFALTTQMCLQRWSLYNVFMVIPVRLLNTLARRMAAFEGLGLVDEQHVPIALNQAQSGPSQPADDGPVGAARLSVSRVSLVETQMRGLLARLLSCFAFWRAPSSRVSPIYTKRRLDRSHLPALWLSSPFIAWGVMMIAINATAHSTLATVPGPVAIFNLVNFVVIQFHRAVTIMEDTIQTTSAFSLAKDRIRMQLYTLPTQYKAMVLGSSAVANETSAHFTLATSGVAFSSAAGADILYNTRSCLRSDQSTCLNSSHPLYPYTRGGLDKMMQLFMDTVNSARALNDSTLAAFPVPHGQHVPQFSVMWNIRGDIEGGLTKLNVAFYEHVIDVYRGTLTIHIMGLVLSVLLMAVFVFLMLRPYVGQMKSESRRIAQLLSMLPPDVDVEGLVRSAQITSALSSGKYDGKTANNSMAGSSLGGSDAFEP